MEYQTDSTYDGEYDALLDILNGNTHSCKCGLIMDRDLNAAINILRLGTQSLKPLPYGGLKLYGVFRYSKKSL